MERAGELSLEVGKMAACLAFGLSRATFYRHEARIRQPQVPAIRPSSPLALMPEERTAVLEVLHSERFMDVSVAEVFATLLDEGQYFCSTRTMYRILEAEGELQERRRQRQHGNYTKPELIATGPNQVWSWDITKLKGPQKWTYFYLYVLLDIFSRYVVGWMIAHRESAVLAKQLIQESCEKQRVQPDELTIHSDRGKPMTSKTVAQLYADLGITKSLNRPYVSNDNPFSESQFKTVKYHPSFPELFGSIQDARAFGRAFFPWYNDEHRHSGLNMLTPHTVHYGIAEQVLERRNDVLLRAFAENPARFKYRQPRQKELPTEVWINKPVINTDNKLGDCELELNSENTVSHFH